MRLEERKYLFDIEQAISRLERSTEDRDFADYQRNDLLRAAVERRFEIIGEALAKLAKIAPELAARIPEHRRIIAFRNLLIHGYAEVDHRLVWDILQSKLPGLRAAVPPCSARRRTADPASVRPFAGRMAPPDPPVPSHAGA